MPLMCVVNTILFAIQLTVYFNDYVNLRKVRSSSGSNKSINL